VVGAVLVLQGDGECGLSVGKAHQYRAGFPAGIGGRLLGLQGTNTFDVLPGHGAAAECSTVLVGHGVGEGDCITAVGDGRRFVGIKGDDRTLVEVHLWAGRRLVFLRQGDGDGPVGDGVAGQGSDGVTVGIRCSRGTGQVAHGGVPGDIGVGDRLALCILRVISDGDGVEPVGQGGVFVNRHVRRDAAGKVYVLAFRSVVVGAVLVLQGDGECGLSVGKAHQYRAGFPAGIGGRLLGLQGTNTFDVLPGHGAAAECSTVLVGHGVGEGDCITAVGDGRRFVGIKGDDRTLVEVHLWAGRRLVFLRQGDGDGPVGDGVAGQGSDGVTVGIRCSRGTGQVAHGGVPGDIGVGDRLALCILRVISDGDGVEPVGQGGVFVNRHVRRDTAIAEGNRLADCTATFTAIRVFQANRNVCSTLGLAANTGSCYPFSICFCLIRSDLSKIIDVLPFNITFRQWLTAFIVGLEGKNNHI